MLPPSVDQACLSTSQIKFKPLKTRQLQKSGNSPEPREGGAFLLRHPVHIERRETVQVRGKFWLAIATNMIEPQYYSFAIAIKIDVRQSRTYTKFG